jgi:hypothetical protein
MKEYTIDEVSAKMALLDYAPVFSLPDVFLLCI